MLIIAMIFKNFDLFLFTFLVYKLNGFKLKARLSRGGSE
jgi:hypothetical protein